ncbi:DUF3289 family protein [Apibacter muscae]|uniref:DUF3289 family protein n=1 Tax=Apibacter muscae TaxID=2509004 RepID=UPI0011AC440A|nr:DUF3289 family protein [Apibacter muscae]TWP22973.1 DUF3289 family protein [Apibacter muscae]
MAGGKITIRAGGKITKVSEKYSVYTNKLTLNSNGPINITSDKDIIYGAPEQPKTGGEYILRGWWSSDQTGEDKIKSSFIGEQVFFVVETKNIAVGEEISFVLYDDSSLTYQVGQERRKFQGETKKTEIPLIHTGTNEPYTTEKINSEGKAIINFYVTENKFISELLQQDKDGYLELFFKISYKDEQYELPIIFGDYLKVYDVFPIDRFKMPGINRTGDGVADDMTFGRGVKSKPPIYTPSEVSNYKDNYTRRGFSLEQDADWVNYIPSSGENTSFPERKEQGKAWKPEEIVAKKDNLQVAPTEVKPLDYITPKVYKKALYNKKDIFNTKYKKEIKPRGVLIARYMENTGEYTEKLYKEYKDRYGTLAAEKHFERFKSMVERYFDWRDLQGNIGKMVDKFKQNEGGIYESELLSQNLAKQPATLAYCQKIEDYLSLKLKESEGDFQILKDQQIYFEKREDFDERKKKQKQFGRIMYSWGFSVEGAKNMVEGRTIALNDIWAREVYLTGFKKINAREYKLNYRIILWDHFGLDLPDMEKLFNILPQASEIFAHWFILQHLYGYRPFVTQAVIEREFSGNIYYTRQENIKAQQAEQAAKENEAQDAQQKVNLNNLPKW